LPAKHVIHTVGPDGADTDRADKLRYLYQLLITHNY
jgi:O-acetyl-ADP-ribose deacetylase (regulator of RNase III)